MPLYRTHEDDLIAELGEAQAALRDRQLRLGGRPSRPPEQLRPRAKRHPLRRATLRAA